MTEGLSWWVTEQGTVWLDEAAGLVDYEPHQQNVPAREEEAAGPWLL